MHLAQCEAFLIYIEEAAYIRLRGSRRLRLAEERYKAYVKAYQTTSAVDLFHLRGDSPNYFAHLRACKDRDAGIPMYLATEADCEVLRLPDASPVRGDTQ